MKSRDKAMASLLRDGRLKDFDVIALQEPWRNPFWNTTHHPDKQHFELLYMDDPTTRVYFFINKRIPATSWTITHHSPDLSTLHHSLAAIIVGSQYSHHSLIRMSIRKRSIRQGCSSKAVQARLYKQPCLPQPAFEGAGTGTPFQVLQPPSSVTAPLAGTPVSEFSGSNRSPTFLSYLSDTDRKIMS
jgi:hypothetical protein